MTEAGETDGLSVGVIDGEIDILSDGEGKAEADIDKETEIVDEELLGLRKMQQAMHSASDGAAQRH
jgi:hypothetical protein